MSVDKPVRPASEVVGQIEASTLTAFGPIVRLHIVEIIEADRAEVRAAALEEAADVAKKQKEFYDGLRDQCARKSDEYNLYDEDAGVCHIIERDIRALATRSTEEPEK